MIYIDLPRAGNQPAPRIVVQGEYGIHAIRWDAAQFKAAMPDGQGTIWYQAPGGEAYALTTEQDGAICTAVLGATETATPGMARACLIWSDTDAMAKFDWRWLEIIENAAGAEDEDEQEPAEEEPEPEQEGV